MLNMQRLMVKTVNNSSCKIMVFYISLNVEESGRPGTRILNYDNVINYKNDHVGEDGNKLYTKKISMEQACLLKVLDRKVIEKNCLCMFYIGFYNHCT